ncbi:MAG: histidine kinase N-terminal 7TM domain-containing protein [Anaerolineales bacterium]
MLDFLETTNRVFEAGIAITALSLFLRALTFNLRDRVSRAFAVILACVMITSAGEAISDSLPLTGNLEFWLNFPWVGTIFLPAAYLHFSDALLETTGRPSRGRRRLAVRLSYVISAIFLALLVGGTLLGPAVLAREPVPHLTRTTASWIFTIYYLGVNVLALFTIWRSWQRTVLSASRRRLTYLFLGSLALAFGAYPFLLLGSGAAIAFPELFFLSAALGNVLVFGAMVAMAYATAFFGVPWPDRVVKSRLFRWLLRGPVTVFIVLALMPLVAPISALFNTQAAIMLPILIALSALITSHLITLFTPTLERWLLFAGDAGDVDFVQNLQERFLTDSDLRQFLEAVLAAVCDRLRVKTAFVAAVNGGELRAVVQVGSSKWLEKKQAAAELKQAALHNNGVPDVFSWGKFWILPLHTPQSGELIGLLGVMRHGKADLTAEQQKALADLGERATLALDNRRRQTEALASLESLGPRVDLIQRLRAASRFDQSEVLSEAAALPEYSDLVDWVKDALTHYWGGPKLTESPLRDLQVVQQAIADNESSPAQAVRTTLRAAIERNKPQGEPKLSGEWLLYNLLELKFLQGRKVRDVAMRLAMSEPDLYRKQRVAIEAVARSLLEMESKALKHQNGKEA